MTRLRLSLATSLLALAALLAVLAPTTRWWPRDAPAADRVADTAPLALDWEDLVPAGFEPTPDPFMTMSAEALDKLMDGSPESRRELERLDAAMRYAPVDEALDGKHVTLPGYVVPLDFDGNTRLKEFLLVPYFGACIHTPPPPANQIVMAELDEPVDVGDTYEPVQLRGILRAQATRSDLAEAGYLMEVLSVGPLPR